MDIHQSKDIAKLVRAKHQWETMLDALPQLICLLDLQGKVVRVNKTLEKWGLGDVTKVKNKSFHEMLHPGCVVSSCMLKKKLLSLFEKITKNKMCEWQEFDPVINKELTICIGESDDSKYSDDFNKKNLFVVVTDITMQTKVKRILSNYNLELRNELKKLTKELTSTNLILEAEIIEHKQNLISLEESRKKYNCLVETTLTGLYVMEDKKITFCNRRFAEIFNYTKEQITRLELHDLIVSSLDKLFSEGDLDSVNDKGYVIEGRTKEGLSIWLRCYHTRVVLQDKNMVMGSVIDITHQKTMEDSLRLSQHELQSLSEKLLKSEEEQRKHIALELHDSVGQSIYAIKMGLENILLEYQKNISMPMKTRFENEIEKLQGASEEIRNISMNLRPSMLDDLGLIATINWFVREFNYLYPNIKFTVGLMKNENNIPEDLKIVVFRIIQEALNNIGKHAKATHIKIKLSMSHRNLILKVQDDGKGFEYSNSYIGKGFGLSSMRERVKLSSGEFQFSSAPGEGVKIYVTWSNI